MKNVAFHNLGCKVNSYELDVVQQNFVKRGYIIVPFDQIADIYVINTCTVTNIADRKSRQMIRRAKKQNPRALVVALGCYVQTGKEDALQDSDIDIAIGNNKKKDTVEIVEAYLQKHLPVKAAREAGTNYIVETTDGTQDHVTGAIDETKAAYAMGTIDEAKAAYAMGAIDETKEAYEEGTIDETKADHVSGTAHETERNIIDINHTHEYEEMKLEQTGEHTRAYIKIQDGCNQFCSYCIIPFARGRVRSRLPEDICEEIRGLADKGYCEFVLTGIHISSYGVDFEDKITLLDLILQIREIGGVKRIRLGSLEPRIVTEEFASALGKIDEICPHFHLSLQSGCDETLKRMNRRYTAAEYKEGVDRLRKYFTNPAITTDVIVGFPGETDREFERTEVFLRETDFFEMHIFPYSARKGTVAAGMKEQVEGEVKKNRSRRLLALEKEQSKEYRKQFVGQEETVLFEEMKEIEGKFYQIGHTKRYVKVAKETLDDLSGRLIQGKIIGMLNDEMLLME